MSEWTDRINQLLRQGYSAEEILDDFQLTLDSLEKAQKRQKELQAVTEGVKDALEAYARTVYTDVCVNTLIAQGFFKEAAQYTTEQLEVAIDERDPVAMKYIDFERMREGKGACSTEDGYNALETEPIRINQVTYEACAKATPSAELKELLDRKDGSTVNSATGTSIDLEKDYSDEAVLRRWKKSL